MGKHLKKAKGKLYSTRSLRKDTTARPAALRPLRQWFFDALANVNVADNIPQHIGEGNNTQQSSFLAALLLFLLKVTLLAEQRVTNWIKTDLALHDHQPMDTPLLDELQ